MRYGTNSENTMFFLKGKNKTQLSRQELREGVTTRSNGKQIGTDIIQKQCRSQFGSQGSNNSHGDKLEGKAMKQGGK